MATQESIPESNQASEPAQVRLDLPSDVWETATFLKLRWQMVSTTLRQALNQSRLRAALLIWLCGIFWLGLFWIFREGFYLLHTVLQHPGMRDASVFRIYNVFFLALTVMLTLSSAIILYGGLFRSDSTDFLLTTPASSRRIVLSKFSEAALFSGWGFMLLGTPMLVAYGVEFLAPLSYFILILPLLISFTLIPTCLGGILCLAVVNFLPRARYAAVFAILGVLLGLAILGGSSLFQLDTTKTISLDWFHTAMGRWRFAEQRLLPSYWLTTALLEAAKNEPGPGNRPAWWESIMFFSVLVANGLVLYQLVGICGQAWLRTGYSRLKGISRGSRPIGQSRIDRAVLFFLSPLPATMRLLLVKDIRIFRRDLLQWSQVAIFFGLLLIYFFNIRRFHYGPIAAKWITMVGFLNVAVVGLILSTFTTRFIYPMISLEGRRFWILGTLPIDRQSILWSKFIFAVGGSLIPCTVLVFLSDLMLGILTVSPLVGVVHIVSCWVLCWGLCGLAVGLGARLPEFREPQPSKIAAGFGGTLNLVLSALLIISVTGMTAIPSYFSIVANEVRVAPHWLTGTYGLGSTFAVLVSLACAVLLGILATAVPMRIGIRSFRRLEF